MLNAAKDFVTKYSGSGLAYATLGQVYEKTGFTEDAIAAHQHALKLKADDPGTWASLAEIYKQKENVTQADFALSQAISYQTKRVQSRAPGSDDSSLWFLGNYYRSAGNNEAAKQLYLQDVQERPQLSFAFDDLVDIYLSEGNEKAAFPMAYQIMLKASRNIPEAEAWDYLAHWYYEHNRDVDGYRCSLNAKRLGLQR